MIVGALAVATVLACTTAFASHYLALHATRVVCEFQLPNKRGKAVVEANATTVTLTVSGRRVPIDVARLRAVPGIDLVTPRLFRDSQHSEAIYLMFDCGTAGKGGSATGSVVMEVRDFKVLGIEDQSCGSGEARDFNHKEDRS